MKKTFTFLLTAMVLAACSGESYQEPNENPGDDLQALVITPNILASRAGATVFTADDYFSVTGYEEATVYAQNSFEATIDPGRIVSSEFKYSGGSFSAESAEKALYYPSRGILPNIELYWPKMTMRQIPTDQSTKDNFLKADWLYGTKSDITITPSLPLDMIHQNSLIIFTLGGAQTGKKIEELVVNGYSAYCHADASYLDAQMILRPQTALPFAAGDIVNVRIAGETVFRHVELASTPQLEAASISHITLSVN